ncbi:MAG: DUF4397 domain-containing protein [Bacteroidia bacterium]
MKRKNLLLTTMAMSLGILSSFAQTARVQVIHNSADLAAQTVDVWLDNTLLIDNFQFRTASPFINAPAGTPLTIGIAPANSTSAAQSIATFPVTLAANETYVVVANGIVSATGYSPATPFNLHIYNMGRETASNSSNTDVLVFHGATDAPTVDVVGVGAGTLVDNLAYAQFSNGYLQLPTADYNVQIRNQAGTDVVAEYLAPLQSLNLDGEALVVVASGFLNPANNSNGPAFGLYAAPVTGGSLIALPSSPITTARVQVIHNSADAAAQTVDVWLDNTLIIDDFAFRTSSPFIDAPAGTQFTIGIAPANSTSSSQAIATFPVTLNGNGKYVVVANGIVSATGYSPATPFNLHIYNMGRETASNSSNTDVLVFHGATDAPIVDVVGVGAGTLVDNLAYAQFSNGYLQLPTADYNVQIRNQAGTDVVAEYLAPLQSLNLDGEALVVVASGFLNPANNSNGPAFGLYAAPVTGGNLVQLPSTAISTARVQVIHNSADAAAQTVDVWLNNTLLLDNFAFRTASPFVDAPAGSPFTIGIAPANSTSSSQAIATFPVTLNGNGKYIVVANGIVSSSGYSPNKPFNLYVYPTAREVANSSSNTDVLVFHGATDAPTVDVVATGNGLLVDDLAYTEFAGYLSLPTNNYELLLTDSAGATPIAKFGAPLSALNLQGAAITVLASGFVNPSANSNGPAFGLYAATAAGGALVALPVLPTPSGLNENNSILNVNLYPNPVNTIINFVADKDLVNAQIIIMDISGRAVKQYTFNTSASAVNSIDVSDLTNGIYLMQLNNNGEVNTFRFIKKF